MAASPSRRAIGLATHPPEASASASSAPWSIQTRGSVTTGSAPSPALDRTLSSAPGRTSARSSAARASAPRPSRTPSPRSAGAAGETARSAAAATASAGRPWARTRCGSAAKRGRRAASSARSIRAGSRPASSGRSAAPSPIRSASASAGASSQTPSPQRASRSWLSLSSSVPPPRARTAGPGRVTTSSTARRSAARNAGLAALGPERGHAPPRRALDLGVYVLRADAQPAAGERSDRRFARAREPRQVDPRPAHVSSAGSSAGSGGGAGAAVSTDGSAGPSPGEPREADVERSAGVLQVIAAQLLQHRVRQRDRDHRLGHDAPGGHDEGVGADVSAFRLFAGRQIDGHERPPLGRDRLEPGARHDRFAVRDPALDPACAVRPPHDPFIPEDLVLRRASQLPRGRHAVTDRSRLHGLNREERRRERSFEPRVPLGVGADARRHAERDDLGHAAQCLLALPGLFDPGEHRLLDTGIRAIQRAPVARVDERAPVAALRARVHAADRHHVSEDPDPELPQERVRHRAERDPHRGLARARALDRRVRVGERVLEHPGQVGVAGPRNGADRLAVLGDHAPVLDRHADRRARRLALPDAGHDLRAVALDLHPGAASHASLPPPQIAVDCGGRERDARGDPVEDADEPRAVGLAGRQHAQAAADHRDTWGATSRATARKSSSYDSAAAGSRSRRSAAPRHAW